MDLKAVGQRIKAAREAKNLTQEELAGLVNLSPTHVSVIERGLKVTKLDTFIAIANALDVSADTLLIDVVTHSVSGVTNELSEMIEKLPNPDKPEKLFLFSTPCVILKKKGVFICYSLINTLIKFMASLPVMTA